MALEEVKKKAAKLKKNAWLAMDKRTATIMPRAAPDIFTDLRFKAVIIKANGAKIENSHRVSGITLGSANNCA